MDIGSMAAALASMKTATDIATALLGLKTDAAVQSKAAELTGALLQVQQQLMTAQMEQMSMLAKIRDLEAENSRLTKQNDLRNSYQLHQFPDTGSFAYKSRNGTEPDHYLCSTCFDAGDKVVLQPCAYGYQCHKCTTYIATRKRSRYD